MTGRTFTGRCRTLGRGLESALLPRRCVFCGLRTARRERYLCRGCRGDLVWNAPACRGCARPLGATSATVCGECQARPPAFNTVIAPLAYTYPVDAAIKAFKFHRRLFYVPAFAELLQCACADLPAAIDAVQPVPLHRWRQLKRGFNQARELALPVARELRVPLVDYVRRCRHTPYQSGLPAADRRRNLEGAFELRRPVAARHVLLVDDVITTASTCGQIARLLRREGVGDVSVLALARARA